METVLRIISSLCGSEFSASSRLCVTTLFNAGARRLVFVVGGPYGFDPSIHTLAKEEISLSQMTFSHQLIRVLFVEQLYRALTILKGDSYHHE